MPMFMCNNQEYYVGKSSPSGQCKNVSFSNLCKCEVKLKHSLPQVRKSFSKYIRHMKSHKHIYCTMKQMYRSIHEVWLWSSWSTFIAWIRGSYATWSK